MNETNDLLTHVNKAGAANMVDISEKTVTHRTAKASARIAMNAAALTAIRENALAKGEAIGAARIAGILAAKKVPDLIPLCHSLPLSCVDIDITFESSGLLIVATAATDAKTGVEMEAMMACTVAALTVYDMAKAIDKSMIVSDIKLIYKAGGRSGIYRTKE